MAPEGEWDLPRSAQPQPGDYTYDLDRALSSVVGVRATVPADAFTAETLGTERLGNGVVIGDGLVLTIGYLVSEADSIWLSRNDGRAVPGHVLAYDAETGFGLVQALAALDLPALPIGKSSLTQVGDDVVVGGAGGRERSLAARIIAKQEFAGYWEYVLDEAIFTAPAHPHWGGTALINQAGELIGVGSLQLQQAGDHGREENLNMIVPIDLLTPILDDLVRQGRANKPPRPWLGLYATEVDGRIVVVGLARKGPAAKADLRAGDVILAVGGSGVSELAGLYRRIWAQGHAGARVPLTVYRDGQTLELNVASADRGSFFKRPMLH